jgi:hypothetical protein
MSTCLIRASTLLFSVCTFDHTPSKNNLNLVDVLEDDVLQFGQITKAANYWIGQSYSTSSTEFLADFFIFIKIRD